MTSNEIDWMVEAAGPEVCRLVDLHIDKRPEELALRLRNPLVTQQIRLLQKAREKLPSYVAARCLLTPMAYEQASSEATAVARLADLPAMGGCAVDLTCGLGVDAWALSKRFERVVVVERDLERAAMARINFERLGVKNIEVLCTMAEEFLAGCIGSEAAPVELIYIDPSRKQADGRRVYSLEESSPNVLELLPMLCRAGRRVMIKLSPLFDVDEIWRLLGEDATVEVVSLGGECKEVLAKMGFEGPRLRTTLIDTEGVERRYDFDGFEISNALVAPAPTPAPAPQVWRYLSVPDVALVKARAVGWYLAKYQPDWRVETAGYLLSELPAEDFAGKCYRILEQHPYRPKELRRLLRSRRVQRANLHRRDFPFATEEIARALGVSLGGETEIFCTTATGERTVFFVERID